MNAGFYIYLLFVISWFTHLTARIPALGIARFDLLLIIVLFAFIFFSSKDNEFSDYLKLSKTNRFLKIIIVYTIITVPFVQWPGSVIHTGFENFIKAIVFYFFTIYFVTSEGKLRLFIMIFILSQSFRVIEPVYLHLTEGYWGSGASMANWEVMDRLSGAPFDVVNPNGLAFIILTVIPFYYFLSKISLLNKLVAIILIPISIYALLLTGSRSGFLGFIAILLGLVFKSKNKIMLLSIICIVGFVSVNFVDNNFKDRYLSIFKSDTKNAATAEGRTEGVIRDFKVALRRPLFGHGLGTSREANSNFADNDQPSHNLYTEIIEELGFVGLFLFIRLIKSIIDNYRESEVVIKNMKISDQFLLSLIDAMQVWLFMNLLFSLASYGLSSYEWYLFAGLSVALTRIIIDKVKPGELSVC